MDSKKLLNIATIINSEFPDADIKCELSFSVGGVLMEVRDTDLYVWSRCNAEFEV